MDKYEYRVKTEQMLEYVEKKSYKKAMEIADTIDWRRVKSVPMLCSVSEIYENNGEYKKSWEVLGVAYDRAPGSRKVVYRLGILALKLNDVNEAMDCYEEFVKLAPKDPNQFILRYKILRAQNAPIGQQIDALVGFKKAEYVEKWAYELAKLYHEAGMTAECLEECDDLILWFNEGKYVYQAMELKMRYKPLTPSQQEKYSHRFDKKDEKSRKPLLPKTDLETSLRTSVGKKSRKPLPQKPVEEEVVEEPEEEMPIVPEKAEEDIAESPVMEETISQETLPEDPVQDDAEVIEESEVESDEELEEIPEPEVEAAAQRKPEKFTTGSIRIDEILMDWEKKQSEVAKEIEKKKEMHVQEEPARKAPRDTVQTLSDDIQKLLAELEAEENGEVPEFGKLVLDEPEEEEVVPAAVEEKEENKGELIKSLFVLDEDEEEEVEEPGVEPAEESEEVEEETEETEDFEEEEEYEEAEDFEDFEEEEEEAEYEEAEDFGDFEEEEEYEEAEDPEDFEEEEEEEEYEEAEDLEDFEEEEEYEEAEDFEDFEEEEEAEYEEAEDLEDFEEEEYEEAEDLEDFEEEEYEEAEDLEDFEEAEYEEAEDLEDFEEEEYEEAEDLEEFEEEEEEYEDLQEEEEIEEEEPIEEIEEIEDTQSMIKRSPGGVVLDTGFVVQGKYDLEAQSEIGLKAGLTEEQKKLFSYFVPVRGMSEQIVEVLEADKRCRNRYGTSRTGNILVIGQKGNGKTVLAVDVVKAIQKQRKLKQGKVAIISGEALNRKEISDIMDKLHGGALIIERAGEMNSRTIRELDELMEEQTGELLIVLEEQRRPLDKIMKANPKFRKKFTSRLELPVFINDELVTFGQTYAKENGYRIDEMGILALYSRIDMMQKEDHAVTVAEVKEVLDEAIAHSQKANVKHLVKRVFGRGTDESDRIILKEEDFKS